MRKSHQISKNVTRFIDAVLEQEKDESNPTPNPTFDAAPPSSRDNQDTDVDNLDKRFASLLTEYLSHQDLCPPQDVHSGSEHQQPAVNEVEEEHTPEDEKDWVVDLYLYEPERSTLSIPSADGSEAGVRPSTVVGQKQEAYTSLQDLESAHSLPMATLVGLSDQDLYFDEKEIEHGSNYTAADVLSSDDAFDEGEDEDSNDEGFYRNDYPEDEGGDDAEEEAEVWGWAGPRRRHSESDHDDISDAASDSF